MRDRRFLTLFCCVLYLCGWNNLSCQIGIKGSPPSHYLTSLDARKKREGRTATIDFAAASFSSVPKLLLIFGVIVVVVNVWQNKTTKNQLCHPRTGTSISCEDDSSAYLPGDSFRVAKQNTQTSSMPMPSQNWWYGCKLGGSKAHKCDILRVFRCPIL